MFGPTVRAAQQRLNQIAVGVRFDQRPRMASLGRKGAFFRYIQKPFVFQFLQGWRCLLLIAHGKAPVGSYNTEKGVGEASLYLHPQDGTGASVPAGLNIQSARHCDARAT